MPEQFAAPIGLPQLRTICDEHDDGRRNWFVTLAYRDLSQLTAAYTHALDVRNEGGQELALAPAVETVDDARRASRPSTRRRNRPVTSRTGPDASSPPSASWPADPGARTARRHSGRPHRSVT